MATKEARSDQSATPESDPRGGDRGVTTHTPGPWAAIGGGRLGDLGFDDDSGRDDRWHIGQAVEGQPGYVIAIVHNGAPGDTLETEGANAHLIAAAPDLLYLAKAVNADVSRGEPCPICGRAPHMTNCGLVAAIAKAEGR